jgi:DNA-binding CsgD family transcriptional regulator
LAAIVPTKDAMPELLLQPREQAALRDLFATEPIAGRPVPPARVLEQITRLIPCDEINVALTDGDGYTLDEVALPAVSLPRDLGGTGPRYVGVMHWLKRPREADDCFGGLAAHGVVDGVAVGFRSGPYHIAQLSLVRTRTRFSVQDLAMLALLVPVLQRLLREHPTPQLPASLTVQERRVLMHVAGGRSNAEIARELFVAPGTIRKHLEHSYRKLGVTNRVSAVARLQGRDLAEHDLGEGTQELA